MTGFFASYLPYGAAWTLATIIGILLIAVVLFLPNGILGGLAQLIASERWKRMTAPLIFWRRAS